MLQRRQAEELPCSSSALRERDETSRDGATALCQGSGLPQTTQEPTLEARQARAFWLSTWDVFPAVRDVSAGAEEVTVRGGAPSLTVPKSDGTGLVAAERAQDPGGE